MSEAVLGIIGGSGIYDLPGLTDLREERSDEAIQGDVALGRPWIASLRLQ